MKDVLKELAEKLPAKLKASIVYVDGEMELSLSYGSIFENGSIYSASGVFQLLQFIEEHGYCMKVWIIKDRCKIDIYPTDGFKYRIVASVDGFGDNKFTEAVCRAALEVAERGKK